MLSESPIVGGDFAFGRPVERLLPYTAEQLFDLAADVERYPAYLPLWIAARIVKREADAYETKQVVGFGPMRFAFQSHTVMRRPEHIEVTSHEPHFRGFRLSWISSRSRTGSASSDWWLQSSHIRVCCSMC